MMLPILQYVIRYHGIKQGSIKLVLNGSKAMEQASGIFPLYPKQRSFGILVDIRTKTIPPYENYILLDGRTSTPTTWGIIIHGRNQQ